MNFSIDLFSSNLFLRRAALAFAACFMVAALVLCGGLHTAGAAENTAATASGEPDAARVRDVMTQAQKLYDMREFEQSRKMVEDLAEEGSSAAMFAMALMEARGNGNKENKPDFAKARVWWEKAAAKGHVESMYNLGLVYYRGVQDGGDGSDSSKQNFALAREWWTKAADQGHLRAVYSLAGMARTGEGQPKNFEEAFKWYLMAAEAGHSDSQFQVGSMYLNGKGVEKNHEEAVKWMQKAAQGKHPGAVNALRLMKMQQPQAKTN
ncbi:sel1 repeat family protein [Desulfovibrio sp. OttesenSCG-928-C06]|nr:sel1 repeat family protein [Desulfovibrio sp. OttesenSCG-928-C06]